MAKLKKSVFLATVTAFGILSSTLAHPTPTGSDLTATPATVTPSPTTYPGDSIWPPIAPCPSGLVRVFPNDPCGQSECYPTDVTCSSNDCPALQQMYNVEGVCRCEWYGGEQAVASCVAAASMSLQELSRTFSSFTFSSPYPVTSFQLSFSDGDEIDPLETGMISAPVIKSHSNTGTILRGHRSTWTRTHGNQKPKTIVSDAEDTGAHWHSHSHSGAKGSLTSRPSPSYDHTSHPASTMTTRHMPVMTNESPMSMSKRAHHWPLLDSWMHTGTMSFNKSAHHQHHSSLHPGHNITSNTVWFTSSSPTETVTMTTTLPVVSSLSQSTSSVPIGYTMTIPVISGYQPNPLSLTLVGGLATPCTQSTYLSTVFCAFHPIAPKFSTTY